MFLQTSIVVPARRRLRRALHALLLGGGLLSVAVPASAAVQTLTIGYQKFGSLILLKARGDLERRLVSRGVSVKWAEFAAGPPMLEAMNAGRVDFGITGETPPVFAQAVPASQIRYLAYEPAAPAGEALLVPAQSSLHSLAELRGRRVAATRGSNAYYLLVRALEQAGLRFADIQYRNLQPAEANAAFARGDLDAWAIWDYHLAVAQQQQAARILANGRGLVDNYAFFLGRAPLLQEAPELLQWSLDEVGKVDAWVQAHPGQAAALLADATGADSAALETALRRGGYGPRAMDDTAIAAQQRLADALAALQILPARVEVRSAVATLPALSVRPQSAAVAAPSGQP